MSKRSVPLRSGETRRTQYGLLLIFNIRPSPNVLSDALGHGARSGKSLTRLLRASRPMFSCHSTRSTQNIKLFDVEGRRAAFEALCTSTAFPHTRRRGFGSARDVPCARRPSVAGRLRSIRTANGVCTPQNYILLFFPTSHLETLEQGLTQLDKRAISRSIFRY